MKPHTQEHHPGGISERRQRRVALWVRDRAVLQQRPGSIAGRSILNAEVADRDIRGQVHHLGGTVRSVFGLLENPGIARSTNDTPWRMGHAKLGDRRNRFTGAKRRPDPCGGALNEELDVESQKSVARVTDAS